MSRDDLGDYVQSIALICLMLGTALGAFGVAIGIWLGSP